MNKAMLLRIRGLVQGVAYRESMCRMARELSLSGWVRNRTDGSVEAFVQGHPASLEDMLQWARLGPPQAEVESVSSENAEIDPELKTFQRRENA